MGLPATHGSAPARPLPDEGTTAPPMPPSSLLQPPPASSPPSLPPPPPQPSQPPSLGEPPHAQGSGTAAGSLSSAAADRRMASQGTALGPSAGVGPAGLEPQELDPWLLLDAGCAAEELACGGRPARAAFWLAGAVRRQRRRLC